MVGVSECGSYRTYYVRTLASALSFVVLLPLTHFQKILEWEDFVKCERFFVLCYDYIIVTAVQAYMCLSPYV